MRLRPMRVVLACALALAASTISPRVRASAPSSSDGSPSSRSLVVGIKIAPPFVIAEGNGYEGLAVELWQEVAADNGWKYHYQRLDLDDLLNAVANNQVDVGLGAITTTARRERRMDFAHPITSSGLAIAVRSDDNAGWIAVVRALVSPAFLKVIGTLALLLFVVGLLAWLAERKQNPEQFGGSRMHGIFSGFWWAMVTMTTVGYGDIAPRTLGGRLLGLVWMLTALLVVSFFTASITSALTVGQLSSHVRNADDLAHMHVASVAQSTSGAWLQREHIAFDDSGALDSALHQLAQGSVEAVVYDAPLLRWTIRERYSGKLRVLPINLERQDYAFALPNGSPLREAIDTSLLARINAPGWRGRLAKYFGKE